MDNASHKPVSSGKKIETKKLDFKDKAKPKVGSKDNMKHVPGGGDVKVIFKLHDHRIILLDNAKSKLKVIPSTII